MRLRMTIQAEDDALGGFAKDLVFPAVRERSHVERKCLAPWIGVMPRKRGEVAVVAAVAAPRVMSFEQFELSTQATAFLGGVILVAVVRIGVLAAPRTKPSLAARKRSITDDACKIGFHTAI